ncbi:phage antirepressor KilAC domain-containing protein [Stutzerimonas nitrititolerans]|uniref:phage antirepressor KilAC domain-containing protein n=1 Tax=Stutzerimonas nitrititolerans TaxID=2482751 RepID=UPI00289E44C1|nr:phage antirepressor KilAC domain-containing protein [Stutzerimonas nitrititolerans]
MNRDLTQAAAVLGLGPRKLRRQLRTLGILDHEGKLASAYRDKGHLYVDTRQRWNASISSWTSYGVVMSTERGIEWLAKQLGITITRKDVA